MKRSRYGSKVYGDALLERKFLTSARAREDLLLQRRQLPWSHRRAGDPRVVDGGPPTRLRAAVASASSEKPQRERQRGDRRDRQRDAQQDPQVPVVLGQDLPEARRFMLRLLCVFGGLLGPLHEIAPYPRVALLDLAYHLACQHVLCLFFFC